MEGQRPGCKECIQHNRDCDSSEPCVHCLHRGLLCEYSSTRTVRKLTGFGQRQVTSIDFDLYSAAQVALSAPEQGFPYYVATQQFEAVY